MNFTSYTLFLCLIVYVGLVALFGTTIVIIAKQTIKLIRLGVDDEKIKTEYLKNKDKKQSILVGIINLVIPIFACVIMSVLFIGSVTVGVLSNNVVGNVPVMKVVSSASMSSKFEKNEYLFENDLNDQLQMYDLIITHKLPDEMELNKYDIVVYEVEPGILLVHRIVNIEEPNKKHPNERYFLLQGDAVQSPDRFPVKYSQMKGIYRGERIPFAGSLIVFMQSTAGVLCFMLALFAAVGVPILEKKFRKETMLRLVSMGLISSEETSNSNDVQDAPNQQTTIEQHSYYMAVTADTDGVGNAWYDSLKGKKSLTFKQKRDVAPLEVLNRYNEIVEHLYKIKGLNLFESKNCETYKKGRKAIAKLAFKAKSLYVYLALNPTDYTNTKYIYTKTTLKTYEDYPLCVKVSSNRQAKWVCELISDLANKNGLYMYAISKIHTIKGSDKSLSQKLSEASEKTKTWFKKLTNYLLSINGIRAINSKKQITYKVKSKNIAKIKIVGKTLNLYLALQPKKFKNTKYKFVDVSNKKVHAKYPMRLKITSDRMAKWAIELIEKI